jgi:hypothetical protein
MPANQEVYGLQPIQEITGTAGATAILPFTYAAGSSPTRGNIVFFTNTGSTNPIFFKVVTRGATAPTVTATNYQFIAQPGDGPIYVPFSPDRNDYYVFSVGSTFNALSAGN